MYKQIKYSEKCRSPQFCVEAQTNGVPAKTNGVEAVISIFVPSLRLNWMKKQRISWGTRGGVRLLLPFLDQSNSINPIQLVEDPPSLQLALGLSLRNSWEYCSNLFERPRRCTFAASNQMKNYSMMSLIAHVLLNNSNMVVYLKLFVSHDQDMLLVLNIRTPQGKSSVGSDDFKTKCKQWSFSCKGSAIGTFQSVFKAKCVWGIGKIETIASKLIQCRLRGFYHRRVFLKLRRAIIQLQICHRRHALKAKRASIVIHYIEDQSKS